MKIDLNNIQFNQITNSIENTNDSIYISGRAGTGKSSLIQYSVETTKKSIEVLASTGIAANIIGGSTIHSFFKFPPRQIDTDDSCLKALSPDSDLYQTIQQTDTFIIDEVSMIPFHLVNAIDIFLRNNTDNPHIPFGGKQIIFVGDLCQLEPVTKPGEPKLFFFLANVFDQIEVKIIELTKVYRQREQNFANLLNQIRTNPLPRNAITILNSRVISNYKYNISHSDKPLITTTNHRCNNVNQERLDEIDSDQYEFNAIEDGDIKSLYRMSPQQLILKVGARIMMTNNDKKNRWNNGTMGTIKLLAKNKITVCLENGITDEVSQFTQENYGNHIDPLTKRKEKIVVGTYTQYPLKLAWAITIHKCQGLTLENAVIDFGYGTFSSGQAYTALTRTKTFEGIYLLRPIRVSDIKLDMNILRFVHESERFPNLKSLKDSFGKFEYLCSI